MHAVGLDIGNATTEAVLAEVHDGRIDVIAADRLPTRGAKGSPASLDVGARLVRRLERDTGRRVDTVVAAPLRPVTTLTVTLPEPPVDTGRLRLVRAGAGTAGGSGFGVGRPHLLGRPAPDVPVVAVVPGHLGYRDALPALRDLADRGLLAAVVMERDEAVLLANRLLGGGPSTPSSVRRGPLLSSVPVVDEVAAGDVAGAVLVAVEVRRPLRALTDPLRLTAELGLSTVEQAAAARLAARLADSANAVVALDERARPVTEAPGGTVTVDGGRVVPLAEAPALLRAAAPGWARAYEVPGAPGRPVDDLFGVDLGALADAQLARAGSVASRTAVLAALHADAPLVDPSAALAERLGVPVEVVASEAHAALLGGRSTPGATPDALVVDLGGGTIDVIGTVLAATVAGAGELLTAGTAALLGSARTAAEYAKRGPAFRVEGARTLVAEDGTRAFLDRPAAPETVGALVVEGPAGWLAVHRALAPGEWRGLRLRLKTEVLGRNVARALGALPAVPSTVVVVGGPAGDDEVLGCVARVLPEGTAVGRGNTAGRLGHRHAVAYGLLLAGGGSTPARNSRAAANERSSATGS